MRKIRFNNRKNMMYNMNKKYMNKKPNNILSDKIKMKTLYEGDNGREVEKLQELIVLLSLYKGFLPLLH